MSLHITRPALEQLAALLLERVGLKITPDGYNGLRLALATRMPALGLDNAVEYVRRLRQLAGEHELRSLLPLVTVGKTEFFRDSRQFAAFENTVLPAQLLQARMAGRRLRLWSAGCATGEEPYSIAMAALELGTKPAEVDVWATDLNVAAVEAASRGVYPLRRLAGVSEPRIARYFRTEGRSCHIAPAVRALVRFDGLNLAAPVWPLVEAASFDVIFCRNVIIYFDQPTIFGVMERFFTALRPGGWLFLGYSESLFRIHTRFEMVEVGGSFFYRKPGSPIAHIRGGVRSVVAGDTGDAVTVLPRPSMGIPAVASRPRASAPPPAPLPPSGAHRAKAPERASPPPASRPAPSSAAPEVKDARPPVQRLADVVACIEAGDFAEGLQLAKRLTSAVPDDLAARLTLGNVHALMGNHEEARKDFAEALSREPLCVEARLYLGIAAMQVSRLEEAQVELTRALFLEPTLGIGHYLLGQVLERQGDGSGARRAYRNAVAQRRGLARDLIGHFPELPRSNEAIAQAAQFRLAALSESA